MVGAGDGRAATAEIPLDGFMLAFETTRDFQRRGAFETRDDGGASCVVCRPFAFHAALTRLPTPQPAFSFCLPTGSKSRHSDAGTGKATGKGRGVKPAPTRADRQRLKLPAGAT